MRHAADRPLPREAFQPGAIALEDPREDVLKDAGLLIERLFDEKGIIEDVELVGMAAHILSCRSIRSHDNRDEDRSNADAHALIIAVKKQESPVSPTGCAMMALVPVVSTIVPRVRSIVSIVAMICACVLHPAAVRAEAVPCGDVMRVGRDVDSSAFARAVAERYKIQLTRVVAADIDRDGDIDVLGATDRGLVVWENDGTGRLTSRPLKPTVSGPLWDRPSDSWDKRPPADQSTIQNDAPAPRANSARAHAPPADRSLHTVPTSSVPPSDFTLGTSVPRAPPSAS
jgi:hypothetical protein